MSANYVALISDLDLADYPIALINIGVFFFFSSSVPMIPHVNYGRNFQCSQSLEMIRFNGVICLSRPLL